MPIDKRSRSHRISTPSSSLSHLLSATLAAGSNRSPDFSSRARRSLAVSSSSSVWLCCRSSFFSPGCADTKSPRLSIRPTIDSVWGFCKCLELGVPFRCLRVYCCGVIGKVSSSSDPVVPLPPCSLFRKPIKLPKKLLRLRSLFCVPLDCASLLRLFFCWLLARSFSETVTSLLAVCL